MMKMEERMTLAFSGRLDSIESKVVENSNQIKELKADVEAREEQLEKRLNRRLDARNREIEDKLAKTVSAASILGAGARGRTPRQEEAYDHHRRTLRIWPIRGTDVGKAVKAFLQQKLKIVGTAYDQIGKFEFGRVRETNERYPDEVVVGFGSKEVRDMVKAAGRNLADQQECGLRINVPAFLLDNYRLLASVGYSIKSSQTDVRRAIKFDDVARDLVLDIRINNEWRRVTPGEAAEAARTNPAIRAGPRKLDSAGIAELIGTGKKNNSPATGANTVNID